MVKEQSISGAMEDLKYVRVKRLVYRASWSTAEVEHFLYFQNWGNLKEFLAADFGFRNVGAENFGIECVRTYGGELYRILEHDPHTDCTMRFCLGKLTEWGPRSSLRIQEMPMTSLAEKIGLDVRERLVPIIHNVTSAGTLLSLLVEDVEPCPWYRVNGAIRAAQIVYLARRLGIGVDEIAEMLRPYEKILATSLPNGVKPGSYVDAIVQRSDGICAMAR